MKNIVPQTIAGLHYSDPEQVKAKADAFNLVQGNYEQVKLKYAAQRELMLSITSEARSLAMIVREMLKPIFGPRYSRIWDGAGFKNNSLETPRSFVDLKDLILMMSMHLEQYSEADNPPLVYMAGKSKILHEQMKAAAARLNNLEVELDGLFKARANAMKELRRYLRVVIDELHFVLPPMDPRWELFGLNRPGRKQTPAVPENVEVKLTDNKRAEVKWPASARSEYYRVWMRIVGVDAEPVAIGSPRDPDFMLEELPANAEIFVSAVNAGGESRLSEKATITTL